jgi:hypothetical protein
MSGNRRDILISGLFTASIFVVAGTADRQTVKGSKTDPTFNGIRSGYAGPMARGVCGRCLYFKANVDEAFATCPMFSRISRWHERAWCSAFDKRA